VGEAFSKGATMRCTTQPASHAAAPTPSMAQACGNSCVNATLLEQSLKGASKGASKSSQAGEVVINEVMWDSKKAGGLLDEDGDLSDWIELHNTSPGDINLEVGSTQSAPEKHQGDTWVAND
jgi:hypothetical protein